MTEFDNVNKARVFILHFFRQFSLNFCWVAPQDVVHAMRRGEASPEALLPAARPLQPDRRPLLRLPAHAGAHELGRALPGLRGRQD